MVSSAGGRTITDVHGHYRLATRVPAAAKCVQLTAVGRTGSNLLASARAGISAPLTPVDALQLVQGGTCQPSWLPTFGEQPGTNELVRALTVFDDGSGPALYVAGTFTTAGGVAANRIARWDGMRWSALGEGVNSEVYALAVYDDGSGPALYAGGFFSFSGGLSARIARWDGMSWTRLGSGLDRAVHALAVHDDGGGPALYAGGEFTRAGGVAASRVAKWDGSSWTNLGSGMGAGGLLLPVVHALTEYDDGGGPALYAAGEFTTAGGVAANRIAKWDDSSWTALGSGTNGIVRALTVFDDGGGAALFAGGNFGLPALRIAKWDGQVWTPLGSGIDGSVDALNVFDDGTGPALHAAGRFFTAGDVTARGIAKWDGSSWTSLAGGVVGGNFGSSSVRALTVFDDGGGPALIAGGEFRNAGGAAAIRVAGWRDASWKGLGSGLNAQVRALTVYQDDAGSALYAGGTFTSADGVALNGVAKRTGAGWEPLGHGLIDRDLEAVQALAEFDDGRGPVLYAGGDFRADLANGVALGLARWDGSNWSAFVFGGTASSNVAALEVHDDGSGPALFVGGNLRIPGVASGKGVAKWNGSLWSGLGNLVNSGGAEDVRVLASHDDGSGPALYMGGKFTGVGGVAAQGIARWDGSSWSALGPGMSAFSTVHALTTYDDGSGPALYAGGTFSTAGGVPAAGIARWDGSSWSALGNGLTGAAFALIVYDDGSGPALYAGGTFTIAGDVAANRIAKWDGSTWTPLGSGLSDAPLAFAVFDGPHRGGAALFAGGQFSSAFDAHDSFIARWQGCPDVIAPVLSCPMAVSVLDPRSGPPGEIVTFTVTASDDRDASPSLVCRPPSGSFFPPGVTLVLCKATDGAGNQSSCSFPVNVDRKQEQ